MAYSFVFIFPLHLVYFAHGSSFSSLSVSLLLWVFLTASLFPQHPGEVLAGCVCHVPRVQVPPWSPPGTWGAPWPLQDSAECPERGEGEGAGTATSIPSWAEPWNWGKLGRCRGPFWHSSCCEDKGCQMLFLPLSFGLKWEVSQIEIDLVCFCPNTLFSLPLLHLPVPPLRIQ